MSWFSIRKLILGIAVLCSAALFAGCSNPFAEQRAGIQVMTDEVSATVFLNGQYAEKTPYIDRDLPAGEYSVRIQPDDPTYIPHETTVTLREGLLTVLMWNPGTRPETSSGVTYELEPISNKKGAEVSLVSIPNRAIVSIDDGERSFTPLVRAIEPGEHTLRVNLPSYETHEHTFRAVAGHRLNVDLKLAKAAEEDSEAYTPAPTPPVASAAATNSATTIDTAADTESTTSATTTASTSADTTISGPSVRIEPTNFFREGTEVLRVRSDATAESATLTFVESGSTLPYTGTSQQGWYQIRVDGSLGWVSSEYATLER